MSNFLKVMDKERNFQLINLANICKVIQMREGILFIYFLNSTMNPLEILGTIESFHTRILEQEKANKLNYSR